MFHLLMALIILANGQVSVGTYAPDGKEKLWASRAECEAATSAIKAEAEDDFAKRGFVRGRDYDFQLACDVADGKPA